MSRNLDSHSASSRTEQLQSIALSLLIIFGTFGTAFGTVPGVAAAETPEERSTSSPLTEIGGAASTSFSEIKRSAQDVVSDSASYLEPTGQKHDAAFNVAGDGTISVDVHEQSGETAKEINAIVIWQDEVGGDPYRKITDYNDFINVPRSFDLPSGHKYKFNIYINDQFVDSSRWISLSAYESTSVDLTAPDKVPLSVRALYQDGTTPIEDAIIKVKSHEVDQSDGDPVIPWRSGTTGEDGWVNPDDLWLQPPAGGGYYVLEVWHDGTKIGEKEVDSLSSSKDLSITTSKAVPQYDLSVNVDDGEGSITIYGEQSTYEPGDIVTVEADPDAYFEFDEWEGEYPSGERTDNTISFEMDGDRAITANFDRQEADLSVDVRDANGNQMDEITGIIVWRNQNWDSPYREVHSPDGDIDLEKVFTDLPAGHEYLVTAYVQDQHAGETSTFTISSDGTVSKTIQTETRKYVEVQAQWADGDPMEEARVIIKSHEGTAWRGSQTDADGWTDKLWLYPPDGSSSGAYYEILIKKDGETLRSVRLGDLPRSERIQINTRKEQPQHRLSLTVNGEGSVQVSPTGGSITDSFEKTYDEGTTVELTADADPGQVFSHWSGDYPEGSRTDQSISVPIDQTRDITATFERGEGSATVDVIHENEKRAVETNALIIWQDEVGGTPFKKIEDYPGVSLPNVTEGLPANHEYFITAYVNDQYAGSTGWFEVQPGDDISRTITVNNTKSVTVKTVYADGETPLTGATVTIESHSGYAWRSNVTGEDGTTIPLWLYPPDKGNYTVRVTKNGSKIGEKTLNSIESTTTVITSDEDTRPELDEIDAEVLRVNGVADDNGIFDLSGGLVRSVTVKLTGSDGEPIEGIEPTLSYQDRIEYDVTEVEPGIYEYTHSIGRSGDTTFADFYLSLDYDGTDDEKLVEIPINDKTEPLPGPIDGWTVSHVQKVVVDGTNYTAVRLTEYPYVPNSPNQVTYVIYDEEGDLVTDDELASKAAQTAVVDLMMSNEEVWEEWLAEEYPSKMNKMLFWDSVGQIAISVRDSSAQVLGTLASVYTSGGTTTIGGKAVSHMTTRQAMKTAAKEIAKKAAEGLASQYTKEELQANPLAAYNSALRAKARSEMASSAAQAKTAGERLKERPDDKRWTYENAQVVWVATSESMTDGILWSEVRVQTMPSGSATEQLKSIGVNFIEGYTGQPAGLTADYTEFAALVMTGELGSGVRTALKETADTRKDFHQKEMTFEELTPETNDVIKNTYGTHAEHTTSDDRTKSASITVVEEPAGSFKPGDWVNTTVRVSNTGSSPEQFFVGYSASTTVNGTPVYYDNEDSTGQYVTVAAGESKTVDVAWQAQPGVPYNTNYDAIVAVWSEYPGQGAKRLDDQVVQDAFTVESGGGIQVQDLSAPSTVTAGNEVTFEVSVKNTAPITASRILNLSDDNGVLKRGVAYVGGGNTSTVKLRYTFTETGTYTLSLAGETTTVSVEPTPKSPVAALTANETSVIEGDSVALDATDSWDPDTSNAALSYEWEILTAPDDAEPTMPTGPDGTITVTESGAYTIQVTVSDSNRSDTATTTFQVAADTTNDSETNTKPTVSLRVNTSEVEPGDAVQFDASDSTDLDGETLTYEWDFDSDGTYDDGVGPIITEAFDETGTKLVSVAVSDGASTVTESVVITVGEGEPEESQPSEPPVAEFTPNRSVIEVGDVVVLNASMSSDPGGEELSYKWDLISDGDIDVKGETVTWTFTNPGEKTVVLTVSDGNQSSNATDTITVEEQAEQKNVSASVEINSEGTLAIGEPATIKIDGKGPSTANGTLTIVGPTGTTVHQQEFDVGTTLSQSVNWHPSSEISSGTYTVKFTVSSDGASAYDSASISVDTVPPSPTITTIEGTSTPDESATHLSTGDLHVNGTAANASSVTVLLSAQFTTYRHTTTVTDNVSTWNATLDTGEIPDGGKYSVTVLARDAAGNINTTGSSATLTVDRKPPVLSATVDQNTNETVVLTVKSDEPLEGTPTVRLRHPDGTNETVVLTQESETRWNASVSTPVSGTYHIHVSGTDQAGNTGHGSAVTVVKTDLVIDEQGAATLKSDSGSFVNLEVNNSVSDGYATVTSSDGFANLSESLVGIKFLTGELAPTLSNELEYATVGIPVNESRLEQHNLTVADVSIRYYNETTGKWERVSDTRIVNRTDNGTERQFFLVNVTHFSTYGAVVVDETAPQLESVNPNGETIAADTENVTTTFNIRDEQSGADTSRIKVYIDGMNVTDSARTSITSDTVTYEATSAKLGEPLAGSGQHEVRVVVVDKAGNAEEFTSTFTVQEDTTAPEITSVSPSNGTTLEPGVVTFELAAMDTMSGLEHEAVSASLNGQSVPVRIQNGTISYAANLSAGTHTFVATVVDGAGNSRTHEVTVLVPAAEDTDKTGGSSGVGGGGGGVSGSSSSALTLSLTDTAAGATISVRDATTGASGTATLKSFASANDISVRSVDITMNFATDSYRIEVDDPTTAPPQGTSKLDESVAYVPIDTIGAESHTFESTTLRVEIKPSTLPKGASPSDIVAYRYTDGSWESVDTTHIGDGIYRVQMSAPESLAIGVETTPTESTATTSNTATSTTTTSTPPHTPSPTARPVDTDSTTSESAHGFSAIHAVVALVGLLLIGRRRR